MSQSHESNPGRRSEKASLGGETVEPRILLSASWLVDLMGALPPPSSSDTGSGGDDLVVGDGGDNTLDGGDGDDVLRGGDGNDTLIGGRGVDVADYSTAQFGVSVDLSAGTASGGAGNDTLTGIEGVAGSDFDDTFAFTNAADGEIYTVVGGRGSDTLDLSSFASSSVRFGDGSLNIDLGNGESFQIDYAEVEAINFGDIAATVLTGNVAEPAFSGDHLYVDGDHAFAMSFNGGGTLQWSYDAGYNALQIASTAGAGAGSNLAIDDLGTGSLTVDKIDVSEHIGTITSSVDVNEIDLGNDGVDHINIAGGAGAIGTLKGGDLNADVRVEANVRAVDFCGNINAALHVSGDVDNLAVKDLNGTLEIGGDVSAISADYINGPIVIAGSLDSVDIRGINANGSIKVGDPGDILRLTIDGNVSDFDTGGRAFLFDGSAGVANFAPDADAGPDLMVNEGDLVTLQALGSSDVEGDAMTFTWKQISGPTVILSDANAAQPTFTAPEGVTNTTVQFQLEVSDGKNVSVDTVDVTITADNKAPTADAGRNAQYDEGKIAVLNGLGSSDPEGQALTYSWRQLSGPTVNIVNSNGALAGFVVPEGLVNTAARFELTVSDGQHTSVDTVVLQLRADDDAPTAKAGPDRTVDEGQIVVLDGSQSTDPEGQKLTYTWEQVSGPPVKLTALSGTPGGTGIGNITMPAGIASVYGAAVAGEGRMAFQAPEGIANSDAVFRLTVSDGKNTSVDHVTIRINADNDAPSVDAGPNRVAASQQAVTLSAAAQDPENQSLRYQWAQVGGPAVQLTGADTANPTFTTPTGHTGKAMVFVVAVTDGTSVAYDTVAVGIHNTPPMIVAGSSGDAISGEPVVLAANANDVDGDKLNYRWTQVSGPTVSLSASNQQQAFFQAPTVQNATQVTFQVEVNDGHTTSTRLVTVTVEPEPTPETTGGGGSETLPVTVATDPQSGGSSGTNPPTSTNGESQPQQQPGANNNQQDPQLSPSMFETRSDSNQDDGNDAGAAGSRSSHDGDQDDSDHDTRSDRGDDRADDDEALPSDSAELASEGEAVIVAAGSEVDITALLAVPAGAEDVQFTWKQVSGTAVTVLDGNSSALRIQLPETFSTEELVFEVEMMVDGQIIVQEVTVEVQPVDAETKDAALAAQPQFQRLTDDLGETFEAERGIGKVWASLVAFTSMGPRRRI